MVDTFMAHIRSGPMWLAMTSLKPVRDLLAIKSRRSCQAAEAAEAAKNGCRLPIYDCQAAELLKLLQAAKAAEAAKAARSFCSSPETAKGVLEAVRHLTMDVH
jgi:hypothetical protein